MEVHTLIDLSFEPEKSSFPDRARALQAKGGDSGG